VSHLALSSDGIVFMDDLPGSSDLQLDVPKAIRVVGYLRFGAGSRHILNLYRFSSRVSPLSRSARLFVPRVVHQEQGLLGKMGL